jgi:hypothetical protein
VLNPLVPDALLARLRESFPADVVSMGAMSHDRIMQTVGEQRIIQVLQQWHDEDDPLTEVG